MHPKSYKIRAGLLLFLALAAAIAAHISSADEVAVIEVKYHRAEELLPIVQSILSATGTVTVSQRINSFVIVDNPAAIQRVRAYLAEFDKAVEQVRIHVRFYEKLADAAQAAKARARVSGNDWHISAGGKKKNGIDIKKKQKTGQNRSLSQYFVTTASGSPAYIRAGQEIPYSDRWRHIAHRRKKGAHSVTFKHIETGFEVTPRIIDDHAQLKIIPRIAHNDAEDGVIRFYGAQTTIMVPLGQWVEIGAIDTQHNQIMDEILTRRRGDEVVYLAMEVMAEKVD
jgi:type II secretory pathway component GspD/PulD (secretin)